MSGNNIEIKIATLNLCLGLKSKRIDVENLLRENEIKILCLQEVEIEPGLDPESLNLNEYQFELETNSVKARTGIYVNNSIQYRRMKHLEGSESHIIIIDLEGRCPVKRIINVYRSFNPQNNASARENFIYQLEVIKNAMTTDCLIVGDFNIDYARVNDVNYGNRNLFMDFDEKLSQFNLIQLVDFETWSRMVGTVRRSSILDHISIKSNIYKVGINSLANRLSVLNYKIPLSWLNMSMNTFKIKCKRLFLTE